MARRAAEKARRAQLERLAVEKLEGRLLDALDTSLEVMDSQGAPDQARLAAADRIVERLIGKVGERLTVHKEQRAEVTVRYDVERLAEIVAELKALGAIDAEATSAIEHSPPHPGAGEFCATTRGWNGNTVSAPSLTALRLR